MKQILLMIAVVAGQSVSAADKIEMCVQLTKEQSAKVIEATIRKKINKPKGVLAKADSPRRTLRRWTLRRWRNS